MTTILVVDDSESMRTVVRIALTNAGYHVIEAGDGKEALIHLSGQIKIHLIITDLNMPTMDGFEFVTEARKIPQYKFVPVIMLTTEASEEKKAQGRKAGASAWVVKPFQPKDMISAVAKLVTH